MTVDQLCSKADVSSATYSKIIKAAASFDTPSKRRLIDALDFQDGESDVLPRVVEESAVAGNGHAEAVIRQSNSHEPDPGIEIEIRTIAGLAQFAEEDNIPYGHFLSLNDLDEALGKFPSRVGQRKTVDTAEGWRAVYAAIKPYL